MAPVSDRGLEKTPPDSLNCRRAIFPSDPGKRFGRHGPSLPEEQLCYPERALLFLYSPPREIPTPRQWKLIPSERLAVEWWGDSRERRYFIAEPPQGEKLWVYWDTDQERWFLHGAF